MAKKSREGVASLRDIPNVGPRTEEDFHRLGITRPEQLIGKDGLALYRKICRVDGVRHDPCVIDVFMAAVDYMEGAPKRPWFWYTPKRKKLLKSAEK